MVKFLERLIILLWTLLGFFLAFMAITTNSPILEHIGNYYDLMLQALTNLEFKL